MRRRLALTSDGRLTWCTADDEHVGKGRCNHVTHQKQGESPDDFLDRVNDEFSKNISIADFKRNQKEEFLKSQHQEIEAIIRSLNARTEREKMNLAQFNGLMYSDDRLYFIQTASTFHTMMYKGNYTTNALCRVLESRTAEEINTNFDSAITLLKKSGIDIEMPEDGSPKDKKRIASETLAGISLKPKFPNPTPIGSSGIANFILFGYKWPLENVLDLMSDDDIVGTKAVEYSNASKPHEIESPSKYLDFLQELRSRISRKHW